LDISFDHPSTNSQQPSWTLRWKGSGEDKCDQSSDLSGTTKVKRFEDVDDDQQDDASEEDRRWNSEEGITSSQHKIGSSSCEEEQYYFDSSASEEVCVGTKSWSYEESRHDNDQVSNCPEANRCSEESDSCQGQYRICTKDFYKSQSWWQPYSSSQSSGALILIVGGGFGNDFE